MSVVLIVIVAPFTVNVSAVMGVASGASANTTADTSDVSDKRAPIFAAPTCRAAVASCEMEMLYGPVGVAVAAVAVTTLLSAAVASRCWNNPPCASARAFVCNVNSSLIRLLYASERRLNAVCSLRSRVCGARSNSMSWSTKLRQSTPDISPDNVIAMALGSRWVIGSRRQNLSRPAGGW